MLEWQVVLSHRWLNLQACLLQALETAQDLLKGFDHKGTSADHDDRMQSQLGMS